MCRYGDICSGPIHCRGVCVERIIGARKELHRKSIGLFLTIGALVLRIQVYRHNSAVVGVGSNTGGDQGGGEVKEMVGRVGKGLQEELGYNPRREYHREDDFTFRRSSLRLAESVTSSALGQCLFDDTRDPISSPCCQ